jgi:hypothetical protein
MTFLLAEDTAMKAYLAGMTVSDEAVDPRPVQVWFGYPDIEIRAQSFPFVTIDVIDIRQAFERQTSGEIYDNDYMGTTEEMAGLAYRYQVPVAYDVEYQLTTYARHPRHDRQIVFQMMHKFPGKWGYLPVPDDLGTSTAYRHMFLESFIKRDTVESDKGNKRLFRNIYTVRVVSEITPTAAAVALKQTETVNINKNSDSSWTAQDPPPGKQLV